MALISLCCNNCGGALQFDNSNNEGKCPYCGTHFKYERDTHNTIIHQNMQIVSGNNVCADNCSISDLNHLIAIKRFDLAKKMMERILLRNSNDSNVLLSYLTLELSQFGLYEDKSQIYNGCDYRRDFDYLNKDTSKLGVSILSNLYLLDEKYHEGDLRKKDYCVLDAKVLSIINGIAGDTPLTEDGSFLIVKDVVANDGGYSFFYFGNEQEIQIPDYIDGHVVKLNRIYVKAGLKGYSVVVPENIRIIENGAFSCCNGINEIIIKASKIHLRRRAFAKCKTLSKIKICSSIEFVGEEVFYGSPQLHYFVYSSPTPSVDTASISLINDIILKTEYYKSEDMQVFHFENVNTVPAYSFFENSRITSLTTKTKKTIRVSKGECVIVIDSASILLETKAFASCMALQSISLNAKSISIAANCFLNDNKVCMVDITADILTLEECVFSGTNKKATFSIEGKKVYANRIWNKCSVAKSINQ